MRHLYSNVLLLKGDTFSSHVSLGDIPNILMHKFSKGSFQTLTRFCLSWRCFLNLGKVDEALAL